MGRVAALAGQVHARAQSHAPAPGAEVDKLVSQKASVFSALRKTGAAPSSVAIPAAFGAPRNTYGPPPARRGVSEQPAEGEWAEVLYEYSSEVRGLGMRRGCGPVTRDRTLAIWRSRLVQGCSSPPSRPKTGQLSSLLCGHGSECAQVDRPDTRTGKRGPLPCVIRQASLTYIVSIHSCDTVIIIKTTRV